MLAPRYVSPRRLRHLTTAALAALLAGPARAQPAAGLPSGDNPPGTPPAGAPGPDTPSPDAVGSQPTDGSPGLFEQREAPGETAGAATPAPAAPAAASPFALSGYVRGDMFAGKVSGARAAELKSGTGELSLIARTPKETYGDGFAEARIRYGLQGDQTRGTVVDLREAYVNAYAGRLSLRLGQQIVVWGRADALNPTSNLTPVDFRAKSPLEDDLRLGNAGARAFLRLAPAPLRLEGVWMPIYLPTQLPAVALPQYVSYGAPVFPSLNLRNGTEAIRLHLELPAVEMSVSYLYGNALLPGLTLTGLTLTADPNTGMPGAIPPSVLVSRTSYDQQVFGFDFSTALGEVLTLRGEAAYRRPYGYASVADGHIAYPDVQYVVGVDHNFGSLSLILQYMGRYALDWKKQNGPAMPLNPSILLMEPMGNQASVTSVINAQLAKTNQILFSQTAQIQHLGTVRFEWLGLHDTLSISSLCMYNFTTREWVVTPRVGYHLSDALMAYAGAQIFYGPADTLFGLIDAELSAGYVELRYTF
ncbi:MAG TPA: DUF1302 family protein [Polyangia bacterium]|nr:DUF1302 family protein [Polyangia bacterium]